MNNKQQKTLQGIQLKQRIQIRKQEKENKNNGYINNLSQKNKEKPLIQDILSEFLPQKLVESRKKTESKIYNKSRFLKNINILIDKQDKEYKEDNKLIFNKHYENLILLKNKKNKFIKHFLPFNKQWKNSVYLFDKNNLSLSHAKQQLANNFIKSYFNLVPSARKKVRKSKRMRDFLRRSLINNIYISNSEIKQTSDKAFITLYIFDRNKQHYIKKLYFSNKNIKNIIYTKDSKINRINNIKLYRKNVISALGQKPSNNIFKTRTDKLITNINKKVMSKNMKKFLLYQRKKLIRKSFKQSRFYFINFHNIKKNILKTFINNFYFKFLALFLKYFNVTFVFSDNKIILNWPKYYNISNYNDYKLFGKNKIINIFDLNNHVKEYLNNFSFFQSCLMNISHSQEINKLTLNTNVDDLYMLNNKKYNIKPFVNNYLFYSKVKLIRLIIIYLSRYIINVSFGKLYGKEFAKKYISIMWKFKFSEYYNNFIKKNMQKQIFNINKLLFNKDTYFYRRNKQMSVLKNILENIYNKKSLLNVVNIKYLHLNSDNYIEAIKKKLKKRTSKLLRVLRKSLKLVKLPKNLNYLNLLNRLIIDKSVSSSNLSKKIINNVKYKFVTGVRLEAKGRLTKRYTASRSVFKFKYKGNLKNLEYSKKHSEDLKRTANLHLIRGITRPNIQYTNASGTRRIGVFGIKGWVSGN